MRDRMSEAAAKVRVPSRMPSRPDAAGWSSASTEPDQCLDPAGSSCCTDCQDLIKLRRDLHDEIGSALVSIGMQLELARHNLAGRSDELGDALTRAMADVSAVVERVRSLCSVRRTEPQSPVDLATSLEHLVNRMNAVTNQRLRVQLHTPPRLGVLPPQLVAAALMIAREALTNVIKHSGGDWCRLSVELYRDSLLLQVVDNGRGWSAAPTDSGCGLPNMRARARELHGDCLTGPGVPNGFVVAAWLPIPADDGATR